MWPEISVVASRRRAVYTHVPRVEPWGAVFSLNKRDRHQVWFADGFHLFPW